MFPDFLTPTPVTLSVALRGSRHILVLNRFTLRMGGHNYYNNEEVDFLFDVPLSSEIDPIEMPMPYVEKITCITL